MAKFWLFCRRWGPLVLGAVLFTFAVAALRSELRHYGWQKVWRSLQEIPPAQVRWALLLTVLNYAALTGYDALACRFIGQKLAYWKIALVSFASYAISNSIGLALLSGSAVRYRLYRRWGFSNGQIGAVIAFCNASFWLGLLAVGGVMFLIEPLQVPKFLRLPFESVHPVGVIFTALTLGYLLLNLFTPRTLFFRRWSLPQVPFALSLAQILTTALDWSLAAGILYLLLPPHSPALLSYPGFFGIYLLAQIAGVVSNVPGGLGVFETVILFSLSPSLPSAGILGALLAYRALYFWLPLVGAGLTLGIYEGIVSRNSAPER
ncbi:MAG: hypothetical protein GC158_05940 [Cyanobacteria bacterium RI_101]|nr:hypothetical protein [Cyanobacteria bacterium RI_101]